MEHEGLVRSIAKGYVAKGCCTPSFEEQDVLQSGRMGLAKAASKYDESKGAFSTYATFWIRGSIQEALDNEARTVRVPRHVRRNAMRSGQPFPRQGTSLDEIANEDGESVVAFVVDDSLIAADDITSTNEMCELFSDASLKCLTHQERKVINDKYKLDKAQKETARELGATREWVRCLEKSALNKLRTKLESDGSLE